MNLLAVGDLEVFDPDGRRVVDRLTLSVPPGRVVALVGEPGAGAVEAGLALLDAAEGRVRGEIRVGDDELLVLSPAQRRRVRGARVGALFPDPRAAFDPGLTLFDNLLEILVHGARRPRAEARESLVTELRDAGVPSPETTMFRRAGELPRGILQRACVALAAASGCGVVVAEAPTTRLDVLDGADVRALLRGLADDRDVGVLLITEDIAEAADIADELVLMYAGETHEAGPADDLLLAPRGPYTRALLSSIPRLDVPARGHRATPGRMPEDPGSMRGCRFAPRCPFVEPLCRSQHPDVRHVGGVATRCHFADEATWVERLDAYHRRAT